MAATIGATAALVCLTLRLAPESTPAARGAKLANMENCIACHGQSDGNFVADESLACPDRRSGGEDRHYRGACTDYLAYFEIVRLKRSFRQRLARYAPNRLLQGERLVRQYGCFQCHGELGQGGMANAGALKGYIPGYFGDDFDALTRGGHVNSISAWIRYGVDPALIDSGPAGFVARLFLERQAVHMPRYESLPESEIRLLTDYVRALHRYGAMDATEIREYSRLTTTHSAAAPISVAGIPPRTANHSKRVPTTN